LFLLFAGRVSSASESQQQIIKPGCQLLTDQFLECSAWNKTVEQKCLPFFCCVFFFEKRKKTIYFKIWLIRFYGSLHGNSLNIKRHNIDLFENFFAWYFLTLWETAVLAIPPCNRFGRDLVGVRAVSVSVCGIKPLCSKSNICGCTTWKSCWDDRTGFVVHRLIVIALTKSVT